MSFVFSSRITSKEEEEEEEEERKQTPLAKKKFENTTHDANSTWKVYRRGKTLQACPLACHNWS
jgi:hypothetical protein